MSLQQLILATGNPTAASVCALAYWVASCDSRLSPEEMDIIHRLFSGSLRTAHLRSLREIASDVSVEELSYLIKRLSRHGKREREFFLNAIVSVAGADGKLSVGENVALRFLSDTLHIPVEPLFQRQFGKIYPQPGDVSSVSWWHRREACLDTDAHKRPADDQINSHKPMSPRIAALAVLGLQAEATMAEVHNAYRRLAVSYHPDHFATCGPQVEDKAAQAFKTINEAYELLVNHEEHL